MEAHARKARRSPRTPTASTRSATQARRIPSDVGDDNENDGAYDSKAHAGQLGLTPRQAEVLSLLIQGKPNKLICRDLNLAEGTVKIHVAAILKALGVMNRTQAVGKALALRILNA